ncbi:MAG TPA: DUF3943 domain-containing protein [Planctomycetota bacterium]|jgi:hypothetical protein|nr:DUF3943 domain-containing protein [Planctomycetota bacterium]
MSSRARAVAVPCTACFCLLAGCAASPPQVTPQSAVQSAVSTPRVLPPATKEPAGPDPADLWAEIAGALPPPEGESGFGSDKSYWIPAAEILTYQALLNFYDRNALDARVYGSDRESIDRNLRSGWVIDQDPFSVNQLAHPYSGSLYHGFARSAGLNYWESLGYTFAASAVWEVAGETTPPSLNDQIATGIGGSFLGEAMFRTANWILERGGERPGFGRELGAAFMSPPTTVNRHLFGSRFQHLYTSDGADVTTRAEVGAKVTRLDSRSRAETETDTQGLGRFLVEYGRPGKVDYHYDHPFDYFTLDFAGQTDTENHVDHLDARGLLWGTDYKTAAEFDGIWGLYGNYTYLSPGVFRLATTALSVGTTAQDRMSDSVTMQGSILGGVGFGAAGTIASDQSDRDYHYGLSPQALLDLRWIFGDKAMVQLTGRDFEIGGSGYNHNGGRENVFAAEAGLTLRVWGPHALSLLCVGTWRDASYMGADEQQQSSESLALVYTFLGGTRLGAVR